MDKLKSLALNDNGFAFDPSTGESFTMNKTGIFILKAIKEGKEANEIAQALTQNFEVDLNASQRDVLDFMKKLQIYKLI